MDESKDLTWFISTLIIICVVGLVMVYSSSFMYAKETYGDSSYFFKKHLLHLGIGIVGMLILGKTNFNFWYKRNQYFFIGVLILMSLTLIPGLEVSVKGASRWLKIGALSFQPAECLKVFIAFYAVSFFDRFSHRNFKLNCQNGVPLLIALIILIQQPDYGTFLICSLLIAFCAYLTSFPRKLFYGMLGSGITAAVLLLLAEPYRVKRVLSYLDPWKDARRSGFQIIQSYLAFAKGSWFGQGIGNSVEKLFYLPEAHNDFIFSVIGEETGLIGVLSIVLLFWLFFYFGFKLGVKCEDKLRGFFVITVIFSISLQALLNMGVVLGLLPTKGLNLPFISSGGTSLIANLLSLGFVLSALRKKPEQLEYTVQTEPVVQSAQPSKFNIKPVFELIVMLKQRIGKLRSFRLRKSASSQQPQSSINYASNGFKNWSKRH